MTPHFNLFISVYIKFFFLLTPFFVLSMFLSMTQEMLLAERRKIAIRVTLAVVVACLSLFFFGNAIFRIFGLTLDAFRIGAGSLLFLTAVSLVQGRGKEGVQKLESDISVVPLAIPITVGPASIGMLLVMGATMTETMEKAIGCAALVCAILTVGVILFLSTAMERLLGRNGIAILTKITGLILSALAAQIVFTGIAGFLHL